MALTKIALSGSTYGASVVVAATAIGSGTTVHAAQATTTAGLGDELVLYACNTDSASHVLTLGWGGTATGDTMTFTIAAGTTVQVCAGLLIMNSLVVKAAADSANKINIFGFCIRSA